MNFLVGGYALTWTVLIVYAFSLIVRIKKCKKELKNG